MKLMLSGLLILFGYLFLIVAAATIGALSFWTTSTLGEAKAKRLIALGCLVMGGISVFCIVIGILTGTAVIKNVGDHEYRRVPVNERTDAEVPAK